MENSTDAPQKIGNGITKWSSNSTSGYFSEETKMYAPKPKTRCMHPCVHSSIVAKMWKQPKCPLVGNWIEKMWYVDMYLCIFGYRYLCVCVCVCVWNISHKNEIVSFATTWYTEYYAKWNKSKEIQSHLYVKTRKTRLIDTESKWVVARFWGRRMVWAKQVMRIKRDKLLVVK